MDKFKLKNSDFLRLNNNYHIPLIRAPLFLKKVWVLIASKDKSKRVLSYSLKKCNLKFQI